MGNLEYIDHFFSGEPVPEQVLLFEKRIAEDAVFAGDVAFYLNLRQVAADQVLAEKKRRFGEIYRQGRPGSRLRSVRRSWYTIAAAAIVAALLLGVYLFLKDPASERMASRYIRENFQSLGVNMGNVPDDLQAGIRLANEDKLDDAHRRFEAVLQSDSSNFNAAKYAGIVSLRLGHYDKALAYFGKLASHPGLYANPGTFYQAVTLLKRNVGSDKEQARALLRQVVAGGLEGKETAREWLKAL